MLKIDKEVAKLITENKSDEILFADVVVKRNLETMIYKADNTFYAMLTLPGGTNVQAAGHTKDEVKSDIGNQLAKHGYMVTDIFGDFDKLQNPEI